MNVPKAPGELDHCGSASPELDESSCLGLLQRTNFTLATCGDVRTWSAGCEQKDLQEAFKSPFFRLLAAQFHRFSRESKTLAASILANTCVFHGLSIIMF